MNVHAFDFRGQALCGSSNSDDGDAPASHVDSEISCTDCQNMRLLPPDQRQTYAAMRHWYRLAQKETEQRDWDVSHVAVTGAHPSSYNARIESYLNTARSLRLELETGEPHCSCHMLTQKELVQRGGLAKRVAPAWAGHRA